MQEHTEDNLGFASIRKTEKISKNGAIAWRKGDKDRTSLIPVREFLHTELAYFYGVKAPRGELDTYDETGMPCFLSYQIPGRAYTFDQVLGFEEHGVSVQRSGEDHELFERLEKLVKFTPSTSSYPPVEIHPDNENLHNQRVLLALQKNENVLPIPASGGFYLICPVVPATSAEAETQAWRVDTYTFGNNQNQKFLKRAEKVYLGIADEDAKLLRPIDAFRILKDGEVNYSITFQNERFESTCDDQERVIVSKKSLDPKIQEELNRRFQFVEKALAQENLAEYGRAFALHELVNKVDNYGHNILVSDSDFSLYSVDAEGSFKGSTRSTYYPPRIEQAVQKNPKPYMETKEKIKNTSNKDINTILAKISRCHASSRRIGQFRKFLQNSRNDNEYYAHQQAIRMAEDGLEMPFLHETSLQRKNSRHSVLSGFIPDEPESSATAITHENTQPTQRAMRFRGTEIKRFREDSGGEAATSTVQPTAVAPQPSASQSQYEEQSPTAASVPTTADAPLSQVGWAAMIKTTTDKALKALSACCAPRQKPPQQAQHSPTTSTSVPDERTLLLGPGDSSSSAVQRSSKVQTGKGKSPASQVR